MSHSLCICHDANSDDNDGGDLTITTALSRERTSTEEIEENLQRGIERSETHEDGCKKMDSS